MHDPSLETAAVIPTAPDEYGIPVERQRAECLGPDFDPDYFAKLDQLIEENYGPMTGEFRIVSGLTCAAPAIKEISMTELTKCDLCDEIAAFEYLAEGKFVYGAGEDRAVLSATVEVTECRSCGEAYTAEHGEIQRELAVREHLAALSTRLAAMSTQVS